jgi:hypothetical protein
MPNKMHAELFFAQDDAKIKIEIFDSGDVKITYPNRLPCRVRSIAIKPTRIGSMDLEGIIDKYYYNITYLEKQNKGYRSFLDIASIPATEENKKVMDLLVEKIKKSSFKNWQLGDDVLIFKDKKIRLYD